MNHTDLSSNEYINLSGQYCPKCRSLSVESGGAELDGATGWANVTCLTCGSQWTDIWELRRYDNLNEGMTPTQLAIIEKKAIKAIAKRNSG